MTQQVQDFFQVIKERRSVRHYDASFQIPESEMNEILQEATLAPSSNNLQPWRFLVIRDAALKEKLLPIAYNQKQVVEASDVIAVLGDLESYKKADQIYSTAVEAGTMSQEAKETMLGNIKNLFSRLDAEKIKGIVLIDGALTSMQLMLAAKARGYDTVPMGGFDHDRFKEAFHIPETYVPVMLIAIGKAAQPGHQTQRLPLDEVVFWNQI